MVGDPIADYLPTFIRFVLLALAVAGVSVGVHFLLRNVFHLRREVAIGYALITPWILGFLIFSLTPIIATFVLSFTDYNLQQTPNWIGFDNYNTLFTKDINFWPSVRLTVLYSVISVPISVTLSLMLALLLSKKLHFIGMYRVLYYLPSIVPAVAVVLLWRWIFNPDVGLLNTVLSPIFNLTNQTPPDWFGDENWVLPAFIIMSLWTALGNNTVILLGSRKGVATDLYEAASLDGANTFTKFLKITVPMMTPAIFFLVVVEFASAMQLFTPAAFARATPAAGRFMNLLIFSYGFEQSRMGYATALAVILFLLILVATVILFRSQTRWVYYEGQEK
ncbi:MAG TPA: sugar ABC transporter permease [Chloroflexia bacterium]|nr:sugar ABC transporter permease [Chloroflexia bacterium]